MEITDQSRSDPAETARHAQAVGVRAVAPPRCAYPGSHATEAPIDAVLDGLAANGSACTSFYLDTVEGMSMDDVPSFDPLPSWPEGEDHHQGLARTHRLRDGSIWFFLSHSETQAGEQGSISQYRYEGRTDAEHVLTSTPLAVAPLKQLLLLDGERHPSDIAFLPDVDHLDAGYLIVTEEYDRHRLIVYRWEPGTDFEVQGSIRQGFPAGGPNFVFVDLVGDHYYLGIASNNWGWGKLFQATAAALFPKCTKGSMVVDAFQPVTPESFFPFPVIDGACQCKLVRDSTGSWFLLAYHSEPSDDPNGTDYVDLYEVTWEPFTISYRRRKVHVSFRPDDTGFANTGTHHVEPSGRLLLSSSYRWAEDEGPGDSSYVSRVDEIPS
jgi:hypothetical protein